LSNFTDGIFTLLTFFLISFLIFYSLLSFLFHHYIYPIQSTISQNLNFAN
jgi:hypothetical protein